MKKLNSVIRNRVTRIRYKNKRVGENLLNAFDNNKQITISYKCIKTGHIIENVTARIINFQFASKDKKRNTPIVELGVIAGGGSHPGYRKLSLANIRSAVQIRKSMPTNASVASSTRHSKTQRRAKSVILG